MDDIQQTFKARKTILEMLVDRGYDIPKEQFDVDVETFRYLYNKNSCDLLASKKDDINQKIYVHFILAPQIKPNAIRGTATQIIKTYFGGDGTINNTNSELIFVLKKQPNNSILKIIKEVNFRICEFFWLDILQFNITHHSLVPKHILLSQDKVNQIVERFKLKSIYQLPHIHRTDPIVKYFNFKTGSVLGIMNRPSQTCVDCSTYRCVK